MRTLLLAAGDDAAYREAGYHWPKNLVEVAGEPLLQHVVRGLGAVADYGLTAFIRKEENSRYHTASVLRLLVATAEVVEVNGKHGSDFVNAAKSMMRKDAHVEGRFYVCPVYNELILSQHRIGVHHIERDRYTSLADPSAVHAYEYELRRVSA